MRFHRLKVLRRLPHPGRGFTQGLLTDGGTVWESTGLYGQSSLRRYRLGAGQWEACAPVPAELFAEGICRVGAAIWQLTWQERTALRWAPDTLALLELTQANIAPQEGTPAWDAALNTVNTGQFEIEFHAAPNAALWLEASSDLKNWSDYPMLDALAQTGTNGVCRMRITPSGENQFFRARQMP